MKAVGSEQVVSDAFLATGIYKIELKVKRLKIVSGAAFQSGIYKIELKVIAKITKHSRLDYMNL